MIKDLGIAFLLDTSALMKRYHEEPFSKALLDFLARNNAYNLAELELVAPVWAAVRNMKEKHFDKIRALAVLQLSGSHKVEYKMIDLETSDFDTSGRLLNRLNAAGHDLRASDVLQPAIANSLKGVVDGFICFDKGLKKCNLALEIPTLSEEDF